MCVYKRNQYFYVVENGFLKTGNMPFAPGQEPWRITCVYGKAQTPLRHQTWDLMKGISFTSDLPWLCFGDFNEVLQPNEHEGAANRSNAQIQGFRDTVDICMLMDLGYKGRFWTFEKKIAGGAYARVRLDRALASASWMTRFPRASVTHLTSATSDHGPILVNLDDTHNTTRPKHTFRYEVMWESHDTWKETITNSWNAANAGYGVGDFRDKLLSITNDLSKWSKETFGSVRKEIKHIKTQLESLRNDPVCMSPSHPELKLNERLADLDGGGGCIGGGGYKCVFFGFCISYPPARALKLLNHVLSLSSKMIICNPRAWFKKKQEL